jgi:hypothetical protein
MQTRMRSHKSPLLLALVDRMPNPDQNDWTAHLTQQGRQPGDDFFTAPRAAMGLSHRPHAALPWADLQSAKQVEPLMVVQAGADDGGLPTLGSGAFEGRNLGEARLIREYQGRAQLAPIFLRGQT